MWPTLVNTSWLVVPTYLIWNSVVFSGCVYWAYLRAQKRFPKQVPTILDISLVIMVAGFIGARLTHVFFERPELYFRFPSLIFKVWLGGFVFYGGALTAATAALVYCRIKRLDFLKHADFFTPIFALGYGAGRLGCFFAGCCYGRATLLPWSIKFPSGVEAPPGIPLHPTQLYAMLLEFATLAFLVWAERKKIFKAKGQLFATWIVMHGVGRLIMEAFRGDYRGRLIFSLTVSELISYALVIVGIALFLKQRKSEA